MSTLHTLNASSHEQPALLARLLRMATPGDSLLLIENGIYTLTDAASLQAIADAGLCLHALQADLAARGIEAKPASIVDDIGFVGLACNHRKVVSWFT